MPSTQLRLLCTCIILVWLFCPIRATPWNETVSLTSMETEADGDFEKAKPLVPGYRDDQYQTRFEKDPYWTALNRLTRYVIAFLAIVGMCGNVASLLAWSAESGYNPTTFFIKVLAVCDYSNLSCVLRGYFGLASPFSSTARVGTNGVEIMMLISSYLLVYIGTVTAFITATIAFTRWYAVHKPARLTTFFTKPRAVRFFVLLLIFGVWAWLPFSLSVLGVAGLDYYITPIFIFTGVLTLVLPVSAILYLNISMLCKLYRHKARQQHSTARAQNASRSNRLTTVVVCMSVTTLLAYFLPYIVVLLMLLQLERLVQHCQSLCRAMVICIAVLFTVFNASVNVVYYLICSSKFRELLRRRFCCWVRHEHQPSVIPLSDNPAHIVTRPEP